VVFFRDQQLRPDQQLAFARRLGDVVAYPMVNGLPDFPEVVPVIKYPDEQFNFGGLWHADTTYLEEPPMAGLLLAREVPPVGGDTLFANMYLAYETLSGKMKSLVDGLTVVQSSAKPDAARSREKRVKANAKEEGRVLVAKHPAVKLHPETGRKALYVNFGHSIRFEEMTEEESRPILDYLFRHQVRPEFTCRFRWTEGAMALWDNRCTQHNPMNDYHGKATLCKISSEEMSKLIVPSSQNRQCHNNRPFTCTRRHVHISHDNVAISHSVITTRQDVAS